MEQGTGVEPALTAWEAAVIPIYQPCVSNCELDYNRVFLQMQGEFWHPAWKIRFVHTPDTFDRIKKHRYLAVILL